MFDNAYTVAGGLPGEDHIQRVTTQQKVRKVEMLEDSQNINFHNSYSYNMKYDDVTNLSSIGILSRLNSKKGLMVDSDLHEQRFNLHKILSKLHDKNPMKDAVPVNIMMWRDNQIFRKRKDYGTNDRLDDEYDFDEFDRKRLRRCQSYEDFRDHDDTFAPNKLELLEEK